MNKTAGKSRMVELLAPGGSMEGIRAAVNAGADAVYAGGRLFGARAFARNPETEELLEAIDYCHLHGVKLYLTVNTLLREQELTQILPEYLAPIYEHGVDAVLVQDFGVFRFLRERFPDLPLHASTQMTITGPDGTSLLQDMGAERVVLSRELSLDEIRMIRRQCDVELETFVHGALCYCYSGKCLMSSMIGGRSGNRGRCAQPCRLPWELCEGVPDERDSTSGLRPGNGRINGPEARARRSGAAEHYLLSPKDICTLRLLPDLIDAGISSLKIEGRMKSAEYAAGVTAMYRKYIDLYLEKGRGRFSVKEADERLLGELFSRGEFSEGYYHVRNGREMMTLKEKKEPSGDRLRKIQETAARIRERYVDPQKKVPLRAKVSIRKDEPASMCVSYQEGSISLRKDEPASVCESDQGGLFFRAEGFVPSPATNRPADRAAVRRQIDKTGNTDFEFESIEIDLDDGLFVPVRDLNELRRNALDGIREMILQPYRREPADLTAAGTLKANCRESGAIEDSGEYGTIEDSGESGVIEDSRESGSIAGSRNGENTGICHPPVTASVCTDAQLDAVLQDERTGGIYLDYSICTARNARRVRASGKKAYLMMPGIWRVDTAQTVRERMEREFGAFSRKMKDSLDGILVRCYDQLHALKEAGLLNESDGFEVIADAGLYTWNSYARRELKDLGVTMDTLPYECSWRDLLERGCAGGQNRNAGPENNGCAGGQNRNAGPENNGCAGGKNRNSGFENIRCGGSECVVYGYQTLMISAQCLVKTTSGCRKRSGIRYLKDRRGILFPVRNDCLICTNTIYNSVPLELVSLQDQVERLAPASIRYLFTVESGEETGKILQGQLPDAVTRGHIRKGAQ